MASAPGRNKRLESAVSILLLVVLFLIALAVLIKQGAKIEIQVRLQKPYVDIEKCIGCGICEHECPVSGKKAIRISAVGETRSADRKLLLDR
jgi:ferredoxin